jgi:putative peptidoglycan lipid II flippase
MSQQQPRRSGARLVAVGILSSRIFGLIREKVLAHFFGVSAHLDVWRNAMRAPNVLQNMLGEQTLSASFIPVYSRMLAEGRNKEAGRFAGAVLGLLLAAVCLLVLLGILLAPFLVAVLAAGFLNDAAEVAAGTMNVDRFALTVRAVRIVFPMAGLMVLSAWALGVLNSHRRFLLPYMAPLFWNVSIITACLGAAYSTGFLKTPQLADLPTLDLWLFTAFLGGLLGGGLQFAVQLPLVLRVTEGLRISWSTRIPGVGEALRMLGPALAGRGVVQFSGYLSLFLANFLAKGAPSAIGFATVLYNLPLSAFGMSIAAAELPELSRLDAEVAGREISERVRRALEQSAFVMCPAVVGYLVFGYLVVGLIYRGGSFGVEDNFLVYAILCGYCLGLLASTISRLLQNSFFALRDTRTPARIAMARLAVEGTCGIGLMLLFDLWSVGEIFGLEEAPKGLYLGGVGLAVASGFGSWVEFFLLQRALARRLGGIKVPVGHILRRLGLASVAAACGLVLWWAVRSQAFYVQALLVLPSYVVVYLSYAWWRKYPDLEMWVGRLRRKKR